MGFWRSCGKEVGAGQEFCVACGAAVPTMSGAVAEGAVAATEAPVPATSAMATNVASTLAYLAGFITGIIFLVVDPYKSNAVVRFHSYQSIFFNVAWFGFWIVWMIVSAILTPLTAGIFGLIAIPLILILSLMAFGIWAFLMYQAYQQKLFKLPFIGSFAAQQAGLNG